MSIRQRATAACAAIVAVSVFTISPEATAKAPSGVQSAWPPRTITLISGDRVGIHADGHFTVVPRPGVRMMTYAVAGHHYVIPTDALPLLRDDRIDRRLFDITALLEAGYDQRDHLGIIISGDTATMRGSRSNARRLEREQIAGHWKTLTASGAARSLSDGKIWLDGVRKPSLDVSVPRIGAPAAWAAGLDGTGVTVAVLDTGIDATHPDLTGKVLAQRNFASEAEDDLDRVGHGTHVASTIAGSGAASGGRYKGVAPGVRLLDGKVCASFGCPESWILAGMQWAAESGADVVNMSLGGPDTPEVDLLEQAVNDLTVQYGTLFVIAAGNSGPADGTINSPASADAAFAVAAVTKSDETAEFSSRGLRIGDAALKPDITAPGVDIVAANSRDGSIGTPGEPYVSLTGTSMATPHVAGAAAILAQQHPDWTVTELKATLMASAQPIADAAVQAQGAGRVDIARALGQTVAASPPAVGFGVQEWPHADDPVLNETITYRNRGDSAVTLQLSLSTSAPAKTFALSASSVMIPARGEASVSVTADTRRGDQIGPMGGHVVATGAGIRVQTPIAVERERETYTLELAHIDRTGAAAQNYLTVLVNIDTFEQILGTARQRLRRGAYLLVSWISGDADISFMTWPKLDLTGDQTIQLDARQAKPLRVSVPDRTVTPVFVGLTAELLIDATHGFGINASAAADNFGAIYTKHLGPQQVEGFRAQLASTLARLNEAGDFNDSPVSYDLAWHRQGSLFTGFTRHLRRDDLAEIKASYAVHSGELAWRTRSSPLPQSTISWGAGLTFRLPATHTEFVTTETAWRTSFGEIVVEAGKPEPTTEILSPETSYAPGVSYRERWNAAVVGPNLPGAQAVWSYSTRNGDELTIVPSLLGDAYGHNGSGAYITASLALFRDGELVAEEPGTVAMFLVPPQAGRYRVESSLHRQARLSSSVKVVWEFTSAHVEGSRRLPLSTVSFAPVLDEQNRALPGTHMVIPMSINRQPESGATALRSLTVDVSYDDGQTWRRAKVVRLPGLRAAVLTNPSSPGFVSLRVTAQDMSGNTVEQTIIRAYEVARR